MTRFPGRSLLLPVLLCLGCGIAGCSNGDAEQNSGVTGNQGEGNSGISSGEQNSVAPDGGNFSPITLDSSTNGAGGPDLGRPGDRLSSRQKMEAVLAELKPLQVLVGEWEGKTQKSIGGAVSLEEPSWRRDFTTNSEQPALVFASETSPYFKQGRLTYLIDTAEYLLTVTDRRGAERVYKGNFSEPVKDVVGDDKNLQRTFKLMLEQVSPEEGNKLRQVVFNQQENNRYLLELYDRRGGRMFRYDTVGNQRVGTSFALNPDDYRERECIISGGLGTMTVSHNGKSYYVCCSGCRDAFNEDPETWIARYAEKKNKQ